LQVYDASLSKVVVVKVRVPLVTVGGAPQSTGVQTAALPDQLPDALHVRDDEPDVST
jgi:hypothetical protein